MFLTYSITIMFLTYKRHKYEFSSSAIKGWGRKNAAEL
jgi:hypothetical protein